MADFELMQVFHCRDDLSHVVGGSGLAKSFTLDYFVKKFTTGRELHNYVYVPKVDISLVKLDDVRVVESTKDFQLLLERLHILLDVGAQDTLHGVCHLGIGDTMGEAHRSKVATANKSFKFVNFTNVKVRILFLNVFEGLLARTRTTNRHCIGFFILRAGLLTHYCYLLFAALIRWLLVLMDILFRLTFGHGRPLPHFLSTLLFLELLTEQLYLLSFSHNGLLLFYVFGFAAHLLLILGVVNICQIRT